MDLKQLAGFYEAYLNVYNVDEETIDEVTGLGGHVNPRTGNYDNELNPQLKRSPGKAPGPSGMSKTPMEKASEKEKKVRETDPKRANRIKRGVASMYRPEVKYAQGLAKGRAAGRREMQDSYEQDNYDLVLEYLLDEGICESQENAEAMMSHMSQEWIDNIIDEANRGEQHSNLTPLQKIRARNKKYFENTPEEKQKTTQRRGELSTLRGRKKVKGEKSAFGTMRHVGGPYKKED